MRILCLTPWFPAFPGAQSGNFILDSVCALAEQGHGVKVLVSQAWHPRWAGWLHPDWSRPKLDPGRHDPALGIELVSYLSIPRNFLRPLAFAMYRKPVALALQRAVWHFQPDVIIAHTEQPAAVATTVGHALGVPVVVVLHGINSSARLNTTAELARVGETLNAAARVVLVGAPLMSHFAGIAARTDHFRIVPNGFRIPPVQWQSGPPPWSTPLRFISVCNLHVGKGVDLNLQALSQLLQEGCSDWTYTIVGDGAERGALQALAVSLGIASRIKFTGAVDHSDVYAWLRQADVFLLPSWREAFGVAWLEAMACGLLAVGVRDQGPATYISEGETGLLVAPQSVDDLAKCLRRIVDQPVAMQQIARQGQAVAMQHYTWPAHARRLAQVCEEARGVGS